MDENTDIRFIPEFFLFYGKLHKINRADRARALAGIDRYERRHYLKLSPVLLELVFGEAVNQFKPIALAQRKSACRCHQIAFAVQLERFRPC